MVVVCGVGGMLVSLFPELHKRAVLAFRSSVS